jgi:hypothetical protein
MNELQKATGAFAASLLRNASKIKEDRALAIYRSAERVYRRKVEDLQAEIEDLKTSRLSLIDLSPTDINSLVLATDFKSDDFFEKDMRITLEIREKQIRLDAAAARYEELFGAKSPAIATA